MGRFAAPIEVTVLSWRFGSTACTCAQMALLIDKEAKVVQTGETELASSIALDLDRLYGVLQTQADRLQPGVPLHEVMQDTGLGILFPTVLVRLQLPASVPPAEGAPLPFHDYLQHLAHMHQATPARARARRRRRVSGGLMHVQCTRVGATRAGAATDGWGTRQALSMATQIQGDLPAETHKYMAHQVALLYQSVSYSTLDMRDLKKKIEPEFENIKKVTEQADSPVLNDEQRSFLQVRLRPEPPMHPARRQRGRICASVSL